jgi:hypothetical protein
MLHEFANCAGYSLVTLLNEVWKQGGIWYKNHLDTLKLGENAPKTVVQQIAGNEFKKALVLRQKLLC